MIKRFVCAGNLNVDITFPVERLPEEHEKLRCLESTLTYGGGAANTGYWLARLGQPVQILGCVGDDPVGSLAVAALAESGVDTSRIQRTHQSLTGMAAIFSTPQSKRMVISGGANAYFDPALLEGEIFDAGVHLHVATCMHQIAHPLIRLAKERGATVSCDLNERPDPRMLRYLDLLFTNHTELRRWTGSEAPAEARKLLTPKNVLIVTQGAYGATMLGPTEEIFEPAPPVSVVDRTGGGDAFIAGFLYGLAQDQPARVCLRLGLMLATQVIAKPGSRPAAVDCSRITGSAILGA